MAFFEKLQNVAKTAAAGAGDMIETTKLNAKISEEKKKIAQFKSQIGEYYWQQFESGAALPEEAADYCRQISSCQEQINLLEAQIADIRNDNEAAPAVRAEAPAARAEATAFCTNCGAAISPDARFCPNCGQPK